MSVSATSADRTYAKVTRRLLPLLFACYIAAYLDRVNIGFAKLQMVGHLGFSEAVYGFGAGVFFLGYFLFEIPSNLLLARIGARRTIARIMIGWSVVSAATALASTPFQFYVLRFLLGVAEAGFFPGVVLYLTHWFPAARRGRANALFFCAVPVATVLGGPLSGWLLATLDTVHGLRGWQWLLLLEALPSLVLGLVVLRILPDGPIDAHWLTADERALIASEIGTEHATLPHQRVVDGLRLPRVWLLAAIYFCFVMGLYGLNFWLPTMLKELGFDGPLAVGCASAVPFGIALVAMVVIGRHADRSGERRWHIALPALVGAAGLAASIALAGSPALALVALAAGACGVLSALPLTWSLATGFLGGGAAASGIALINSFGNLSGFIGPFAIGWIRDLSGSTAGGVAVLAAALALGALLVLQVPRETTPEARSALR